MAASQTSVPIDFDHSATTNLAPTLNAGNPEAITLNDSKLSSKDHIPVGSHPLNDNLDLDWDFWDRLTASHHGPEE